jgi:hypothetical protein
MPKKTIGLNTAKALATLEEKGWAKQSWGAGEHFALLRFIVKDALSEAKATPEVQAAVEKYMKATFAEHTELCISSNFKKLLVEAEEMRDVASQYE